MGGFEQALSIDTREENLVRDVGVEGITNDLLNPNPGFLALLVTAVQGNVHWK
jgi:hypothetical protein